MDAYGYQIRSELNEPVLRYSEIKFGGLERARAHNLLKYELLRGKGHSKYGILTAETLLGLQLGVRDLVVTKESLLRTCS